MKQAGSILFIALLALAPAVLAQAPQRGGGRSTPIVMGNRVYIQNSSGRDEALQERVMALDADTGKVVWAYKYGMFQSDVPKHRIAMFWEKSSINPSLIP